MAWLAPASPIPGLQADNSACTTSTLILFPGASFHTQPVSICKVVPPNPQSYPESRTGSWLASLQKYVTRLPKNGADRAFVFADIGPSSSWGNPSGEASFATCIIEVHIHEAREEACTSSTNVKLL